MELHIYDNKDKLIEAFADFILAKTANSIQTRGCCNLALAGGSSPKAVYERLASPSHQKKVDWTKVYFFFGDERYVAGNHPQYNGLMAEQTLFRPLDISEDQIYKVDTSLPPETAAGRYMETINRHFNNTPVRFDLILLGLGTDAHTASLFPFTEVLNESDPGVKAVYLAKENAYRISMTAPLINQANQVAFLAFGKDKAEAVKQVIQGNKATQQFPAQLIQPVQGKLHWFLDEKAASYLNRKSKRS